MSRWTPTWFAAIAGISILLLIPCVWLPHIHAGDLSSHVYNAWLVNEVQDGRLDGYEVVPQGTNFLGDWLLSLLLPVSPILAEKAVAGATVMIFFWGAFHLLLQARDEDPWVFCPLLGVLTYGLIFHLGFLNFQLSTGFSLWAIGALWKPSRNRAIAGAALAVLAAFAHLMPIAWAACFLIYVHLYRRAPLAGKAALPLLSATGVLGLSWWLGRLPGRSAWSGTTLMDQVTRLTATEQVWLYDTKYLIAAAGLGLVFLLLLLDYFDRPGVLGDVMFHIWGLHLLALSVLPSAVQFPQYGHLLAYIPQRLSLFTALVFCLMVRGVKPGRGVARFSGVLAVTYFAFLFLDGREFERVEQHMGQLLRSVPKGAIVAVSVQDTGARINALAHVAERSCVGHCYSYANYEPVTRQFRLRIKESTPFNAPTMDMVQSIEQGAYSVQPGQGTLWTVCPGTPESPVLSLRQVQEGERICSVNLAVSVRFWGESRASD